jgi:hypothetical protein
MNNLEKLLAGRKLIDDHYAADYHPLKKTNFIADLQVLGFHSKQDFLAFNDAMCLAEVKKCIEYLPDECDHCKNRFVRPQCVQPINDCGWYAQQSAEGTIKIKPDITRAVEHNKQWKASTPKSLTQKVGDVLPILPGCNIKYRIKKAYAFEVMWFPERPARPEKQSSWAV